jgi:membrane protein DedA with SNARE-associated domain
MHLIELFYSITHWQIDLLALGLLLLSAVVTLIPEELIFITLGCLAWSGRIHPAEAIAVALIGLIPADVLTVWFGRRLESTLFHRRPLRSLFARKSVNRSMDRLQKSGNAVLFLARFTPMLRAPVYLAAGAAGFSLRRAALIDTIAALLQISGFFLLGFVFGQEVSRYLSVFSIAMPALLAALLLFSLMRTVLGSSRKEAANEA